MIKIYAIRCFVGRRRRRTSKLSRTEAKNFLVAARHLTKFLKKNYRLR